MIYTTLILIWLSVTALGSKADTDDSNHMPCPSERDPGKSSRQEVVVEESITGKTLECINGMANEEYPCKNIAIEAFVSSADLTNGASERVSDIWGWTDSASQREFAIIGMVSGTSFVDVSDPNNPIPLGFLSGYVEYLLRDIKTYKDHAFIVSDIAGSGLQIFDLGQLVTASTVSYTYFNETAHYDGFGDAHNMFINEDSGYAYIVGSNEVCGGGGLYMMNIDTPTNPEFVGCYGDRGYTHDVQCIIYDGPDAFYTDKEICFASNVDKLDIIDVSDKSNPELISTFTHSNFGYVHQGWLTEDRKFFLLDDEFDEFVRTTRRTTTYIIDVSDLQRPNLKEIYEADSRAVDHNQFVLGNYTYQANYRSGLRILELFQIEEGILREAAYIDTYPPDDKNEFDVGAFGTYPYFKSGIVLISDIELGLFVVRPELSNTITPPDTFLEKIRQAIENIIDALTNTL